jgi:hypothetical protein
VAEAEMYKGVAAPQPRAHDVSGRPSVFMLSPTLRVCSLRPAGPRFSRQSSGQKPTGGKWRMKKEEIWKKRGETSPETSVAAATPALTREENGARTNTDGGCLMVLLNG